MFVYADIAVGIALPGVDPSLDGPGRLQWALASIEPSSRGRVGLDVIPDPAGLLHFIHNLRLADLHGLRYLLTIAEGKDVIGWRRLWNWP